MLCVGTIPVCKYLFSLSVLTSRIKYPSNTHEAWVLVISSSHVHSNIFYEICCKCPILQFHHLFVPCLGPMPPLHLHHDCALDVEVSEFWDDESSMIKVASEVRALCLLILLYTDWPSHHSPRIDGLTSSEVELHSQFREKWSLSIQQRFQIPQNWNPPRLISNTVFLSERKQPCLGGLSGPHDLD